MSHPEPTHQPAGRSGRAIRLFAIVLAALLLADIVVKYLAFNFVASEPVDVHAVVAGDEQIPDETIIVIPSVLALKLTVNPGAVFGLWAGYRWMFIVATFVAVAVVGYFFYTSDRREWMIHAALAAILAGALGNLYDRIFYGVVRDMLWLFPGVHLPFGWQWPGGSTYVYPWIFNLADAFLLVGIAVVLLRSIVLDVRKSRAARREPAAEDLPERHGP